MKAIISQPMRGKTEAQVRQERAETVKQLEALGYEVVDTVFLFFTDAAPLKYLAKSIAYIAEVDFVFFMRGWENARECRIEHQCCVDYGISFKVASD